MCECPPPPWSTIRLQLVEVRSRAECLRGDLPDAIWLPLLDFDRKKRIIDPSKASLFTVTKDIAPRRQPVSRCGRALAMSAFN